MSDNSPIHNFNLHTPSIYQKEKEMTEYEKFIDLMKHTNQGEYTQRHHIIPLSEGGSDDMTNTIYLSWANHYLAHYLLAKEGKAVKAFKLMGDLDSFFRKAWKYSCGNTMNEDRKKQISESKQGQLKNSKWYNNGIRNVRAYECPEGFHEGRIMTDAHKKRLKETLCVSRIGTHLSEETKRKIKESKERNKN